MASLSAAAIVISHARKDLLIETLAGLADQTKKPTQVIVVETSNDNSVVELAKQFEFDSISVENVSLNFAINAGIAALSNPEQWLWILHDDSAPTADALEKLLVAAETSESVAVVGPKLMRADANVVIQQLGLTATKNGRPFVLVQDEIDQGQHDNLRDVLATSTAGMLVSAGVWNQLGGLNESAPALAQDLDFGARVRAAGFRVIVEPQARVAHHGLSISGLRPKRWTNGNRATALTKSESYVATILLPISLAILRLLVLPIRAIVRIPLHLYRRRPGRIWADISAWLWSWANLPKLISSRRRLRNSGNVSALKSLYATPDQVRLRNESKLEHQTRGAAATSKGLFSSGAIWLALLPILMNLAFFPRGTAITTPNKLISADSLSTWLGQISIGKYFDFDGVGYLFDASIWWHGLLAAASPDSPSLALSWLLFLSPALSYTGIWKTLSVFSNRANLVTFISLGASLAVAALVLPAANFSSTVLAFAIPWALWALLKLQKSEASARANRWLGLSALLLASVAVLSPVAGLLILLWSLLYVRSVTQLLRGLLSAIPAAFLVLPNLLALPIGIGWLVFSEDGNQPGSVNPLGFFTIAAGLIIGFGLSFLGKSPAPLFRQTFLFFGFFALALLIPTELANLFLAMSLIPMAIAFVSTLEDWKPKIAVVLASLVASSLLITPSFILISNSVEFGDPEQVPALIAVSSQNNAASRTAKISITDQGLGIQIVSGNDLDLSEASLVRELTEVVNTEREFELAQAIARVSVGNSSEVLDIFKKHCVGFLLVENNGAASQGELNSNLASISTLQFAGATEFGSLYRVEDVTATVTDSQPKNPWLVLQVAGLLSALLLCIPTPASIRGTRRLRKSEKNPGEWS